jgi:tRNA dimethylallyltransferase
VTRENPPALLLLGPTASGKTACALALAQVLPIEIISVDSALVYRDMDIGTAKPTHAERRVCPHHLIDIVSPEETYSAARFRTDAISMMNEVTARGRIPVLVGGTMLYFKALRDGLSDLPRANPALRRQIDREASRYGWPALHRELSRLDPDAGARLEPTDAQRIQRALEIVRLTGRPLAESYARREPEALACRLLPLALTPSDRSELHRRIELRFDRMLAEGLVEEVRSLQARPMPQLNTRCISCIVGSTFPACCSQSNSGGRVSRRRGRAAPRTMPAGRHPRQVAGEPAAGDVRQALDGIALDAAPSTA